MDDVKRIFCCNGKYTEFEALEGAFMSEFTKATDRFECILQDGFQGIVQIDDLATIAQNKENGLASDDLRWESPQVAEIFLKKGQRGSFARVKINTLDYFGNIPATGFMGYESLQQRATYYHKDDTLEWNKLVIHYSNSQLSKEDQIWLRDNLDLTLLPGGIRVGFISSTGLKCVAKLSFSGLSSEQDLNFAFMMLGVLQRAFAIAGCGCMKYDLVPLRAYHPTLAYNLVLFDIKSVA